MAEPVDALRQWLTELDDRLPADWALMPDIGLYMDQVQTYIDRQLGLYRRDDQDKLLTPAMINNYIKDNLIPRAEAKKYSPVHLALLIMIATLKQVLSMQYLNQLLSDYRNPEEVAALYGRFLVIQQRCLQDSLVQVQKETEQLLQSTTDPEANATSAVSAEKQETALRELALDLSIEARTKILIAEKILSVLPDQSDAEGSQRQKNNGKNKDKKS